MKDTKHKLSSLTIVLHWIIGITIIVMLALGKTSIDEVLAFPIERA